MLVEAQLRELVLYSISKHRHCKQLHIQRYDFLMHNMPSQQSRTVAKECRKNCMGEKSDMHALVLQCFPALSSDRLSLHILSLQMVLERFRVLPPAIRIPENKYLASCDTSVKT